MKQSKRIWLGILAILLAVAIVLGICWIIRAANTYTYTQDELKTFIEKQGYSNGDEMLSAFGSEVTTSIRLKAFYKFKRGETTRQQVLEAVGQPHYAGTGDTDTYLTADKQMINICYDKNDVVDFMYRQSMQTGVVIADFE